MSYPILCNHTHICQFQPCKCTCESDSETTPAIALCDDCWETLQERLCDALNLTRGELAVFIADGILPKQRTYHD